MNQAEVRDAAAARANLPPAGPAGAGLEQGSAAFTDGNRRPLTLAQASAGMASLWCGPALDNSDASCLSLVGEFTHSPPQNRSGETCRIHRQHAVLAASLQFSQGGQHANRYATQSTKRSRRSDVSPAIKQPSTAAATFPDCFMRRDAPIAGERRRTSAPWHPQSGAVTPGTCGHSHARSVDSDSAEKVFATYTSMKHTGTDRRARP